MATETPAPPGILESFRTLGDSLLASAHDRVTLVSLELQEEKLRLIHIAFWVGAIVFTSMMAVTFASLVLVYLFWENARLAVLGGLALAYLAALVAILLAFRAFLARQPRPFTATLEELDADRACVQTGI